MLFTMANKQVSCFCILIILTNGIWLIKAQQNLVTFKSHTDILQRVFDPERKYGAIKFPLLSFSVQTQINGLPSLGINHILNALATSMLLPTIRTNGFTDHYSSVKCRMLHLTKTMQAFFQECVQKTIISINKTVQFSAPCKLVAYKSKYSYIQKVWYVSVPHRYTFNMTIMKGYVPYTQGCEPHRIVIFYSLYPRHSPISTYCGHVQYEQLYSSSHEGKISLTSTKSHLFHHNSLQFAYEVMVRGSAYRMTYFYFPHPWQVSVSHTPSWLLFSDGRLKYVWYLTNDIHFENDHSQTSTVLNAQYNSNHGTMLSLLNLSTLFKQCSNESTKVSVFTGLLTWYQMTWRANPLSTIACNTKHSENVSIIAHWYATVVLDISALTKYVDVELRFTRVYQHLTRNITHATSSADVSYTFHSHASHTLFSAFDISGFQHTVSSQHLPWNKMSHEGGTDLQVAHVHL